MENQGIFQQNFLLFFPILLAVFSIIFLSNEGINPNEVGIISIFLAMSIRFLTDRYQVIWSNEIQILLIFFTLSHNILFSFFTDYNFMLILGMFLGIVILASIRISGDKFSISSLLGILLGTQSMKFSLEAEGWSLPLVTDSIDILYLNWIKFLSAPIIGAIIFIFIRILIVSITETNDESE